MTKLKLLGASALTLLLASPAMAQDAGSSAEGTDPAAESGDSMGDIIVTAQGRAQVAQDVPVAVSVVGTKLVGNAGINDIRGLRQLTPSLQTTTGQSAATGVVLAECSSAAIWPISTVPATEVKSLGVAVTCRSNACSRVSR